MTNWEIWMLTVACIANSVGVVFNIINMKALRDRISEIERKRAKFYKALADPDSIEKEMELTAQAMEARMANRTTLVRDDQEGQHARVFRPPLRSKLPPKYTPGA